MIVSIGVACIDTGCFDLSLNPRVCWILLINFELTAQHPEMTPDSTDHHMPDRKSGLRMRRINNPGHKITSFGSTILMLAALLTKVNVTCKTSFCQDANVLLAKS